jgi:hypothetical protein
MLFEVGSVCYGGLASAEVELYNCQCLLPEDVKNP